MKRVAEPMSIKSPTLHGTILFTMAVFTAVIAMAFIFKVEVVARGQGKVVPLSRVQVLQPEFDGKIVAIHTANGARVQRDQVLIEFDATDAAAEVNTVTADMDRLLIERARISHLVSSIDAGVIDHADASETVMSNFTLPEFNTRPFYKEQRRLLAAEIDSLQALMNQITARTEANRKSVAVTHANIDRVEAAMKIQSERLEIAQGLLDREIASRASFLDIQEAFTALEKERDVYLRELAKKQTDESAILAERRSIVASQRSSLLNRRSEIEAQLTTLSEQLTTANRRIEAAKLRAPKTGVVDQLDIHTIGAVIQSGDDILRVVPEDQVVEIEAAFTNVDIGFLEVGQQANIKLDAYPSARFGFVKGEVSNVAADSTESTEGEWTYAVRIKPARNTLENGSDAFTIRPGMTATVDVTTDSRRLISYFFAPIVEAAQSALGER
ncbi:HlyD family type I secretion periplasmic adaptor subunit [uncultured Tateyamaria sp.]|uniref:HlyD family type I secretion periplasmic adaptor subunit n=1 Tax=uncultured Tateyamaria sp. TaxID=455651 RepID=UPI0026198434|nr:HlyD family type I secretion periplasmic adaptor subunit [uncultured Tateyamaria sp.]